MLYLLTALASCAATFALMFGWIGIMNRMASRHRKDRELQDTALYIYCAMMRNDSGSTPMAAFYRAHAFLYVAEMDGE